MKKLNQPIDLVQLLFSAPLILRLQYSLDNGEKWSAEEAVAVWRS